MKGFGGVSEVERCLFAAGRTFIMSECLLPAIPAIGLVKEANHSLQTQDHHVRNAMNLGRVASSVDSVSKRRFTRKAVSFVLLGITGGFVLSAFDDFAVYHKCSSKALEKAISNERIQEAIGEPITRGAWYNATLALANKKNSVSCTFPIIGPKGHGIIQVKAVSCRENNWHDYLPGYLRWEIVFLEALVHAPTDEENTRTFRINLMKNPNLLENKDCKECKLVTS